MNQLQHIIALGRRLGKETNISDNLKEIKAYSSKDYSKQKGTC